MRQWPVEIGRKACVGPLFLVEGWFQAAVEIAADKGVEDLLRIGAVSPAGGNFEEPVTQSTLAAVKCFLGLSYERAYKRFYPAIDPLLSWSRYRQQLKSWTGERLGADWTERVEELLALLRRGDEIQRMEQVTGEEGIGLDDIVVMEAARLVDMVFLQQDAFDEIDAAMPLDRQRALLERIHHIATRPYAFAAKDDVRRHFTRLTGLFKNLHYAQPGSDEAARLSGEIDAADAAAPVASAQ